MLETIVGVDIVNDLLEFPEVATYIVKSQKAIILETDRVSLLSSAVLHPSAKHVAYVAERVPWYDLWDLALDL